MSKQDRQSARTVTDLTRRYKFGETFAEVMGFATDAQQSAAEAESYAKAAGEAVDNLDQSLDHEEIFNRLTKDGAMPGIYRGEDGQVYINASYIMAGILNADLIKTGVLTSADGTVKVDLINNNVTIATDIEGLAGKIVLSAKGIDGYTEDQTTGEVKKTFGIRPGTKISVGSSPTQIVASNGVGLMIMADTGNDEEIRLGTSNDIVGIAGRTLRILFKEVWWEDNGDGSYTLKGR